MPQQNLNVGAVSNDGTGDTLRNAFIKTQDNFTELYTTKQNNLVAGYGDSVNPYGSKTANQFLAAPNGSAGAPTFRAIVAADIPTLNQNTTGSAATLTTTRTIWGQNFNGGANVTGDLTSVGNITGTGAITLTATSGTLGLVATGANIITASTNGAERLRINNAGNLGIGVTEPISRLHITGAGQLTANLTDAGSQEAVLRISHASTTAGSGGAIVFTNSQGDTAGVAGFAAIKGLLVNGSGNTVGDLAFSTRALVTDTSLTERVRILVNGNVGIGTNNPGSILSISAASPTITLTATTHTGTILGSKNNRFLLLANSVTANNGGEVVWAIADTNIGRWAAISGEIKTNSVGGARGDLVFATKSAAADTALVERLRIASDGVISAPGNMTLSGSLTATFAEFTDLGTNGDPGADDLYVGGYGIQGNRSAPVYIHNHGAGGIRISGNAGLGTVNGILVEANQTTVTGTLKINGTSVNASVWTRTFMFMGA